MTRIDRSSRLRWVPLGKMKISPKAQATYSQARADSIAADFELERLGFPVVNLRGDGWFYVIDGQTRRGALIIYLGDGWETQEVQCETYEGLCEAEEADLFLGRNFKRNPTAFDKFMVSLTAEREPETDIHRVVLSNGLKIGHGATDNGSIGAVTALIAVYNKGGAPVLGRALRMARDGFSGDKAAFDPHILKGLGLVCQRYNGTVEDARMVDVFKRLPNGAFTLRQRANADKQRLGRSLDDCTAGAIVDAINAGKGGKKVPSWWS